MQKRASLVRLAVAALIVAATVLPPMLGGPGRGAVSSGGWCSFIVIEAVRVGADAVEHVSETPGGDCLIQQLG